MSTRLDYDIDNFSGRNGRGVRYNILGDGYVVFNDVSEEEVATLAEEMSNKPWLYKNIEVVEI